MPLLRQAPFVRRKTPRNLTNAVPLYYLDLTGEVFTEYEEFCYRTIQCNSLVWTCAETGRSELTFAEAVESEKAAQQLLDSFPNELKIPALYLASIAQTTSFAELVTDVFDYMEEHYFISEQVENKSTEKWKRGTIISVQKPESQSTKTNKTSFQHSQSVWTPPGWYLYTIKISKTGEKVQTRQVSGSKIRRPNATSFTRNMLWTFLKRSAVLDARGIWVIKGQVLLQFNIQHVKYSHIFVGEPPVFISREHNILSKTRNDELTNKVNFKSDDKKSTVHDSDRDARQALKKSQESFDKSSSKAKIPGNSHSALLESSAPKSNDLKSHKQSRQQNIERYFISSKKLSDVENQNEEPVSSEFDIKIEPRSSDSSIRELCICGEEEDNSSGDEIKVVWSSTVRPRRLTQPMESLETMIHQTIPSPISSISLTPYAQELLKSMPKCTVSIEMPAAIDSFPILPKEEVMSDEEVSRKTEVLKSPVQDSQILSSAFSNIPLSSRKEEPLKVSQHSHKKTSPQRKKIGQSHVDQKPSTSRSTETKRKRKTLRIPHKISWKKPLSPYKKKQKVVATLKPWVQRSNSSRPEETSERQTSSDSSQHDPKTKKKNWLQIQRDIEIQEKFRKQEERQRMKAKQEEEKLKFAKFMKEWRKNREDLLCEDSKPLPRPCEISCDLPNEFFGEFVMILEFLNSFKTLLKVRSLFPSGVTFELLERAVVEREIAGPLHDLLKLLLSTIFNYQILENERPKSGVPIAVDLNLDDLFDEEMTPQKAVPHCVSASGWSNVFQGVHLHDIPLNPVTISEVLRLHLMGSGGRAWDTSSRWLSQRGGYTNLDDPGLWFRVEKPTILLNLSHNHVSELSLEEKLDILGCLVNQVLTYATVREKLELRSEQMRKAKTNMRALQISEIKLQKEAAARRTQEKKGAKLLLAKGLGSTTNVIGQTLSQEESTYEKQKLEKELNKLKADIEKSSTKVLPLSMSHQLLPIGSDRAHRNYWMFSSLPGLYVEHNPFEIGSCLPQPTPLAADRADTLTHVRRLFEEEGQNASSDKENDGSDGDVLKPHVSGKKMLGVQNISSSKLNRQEEKLDQSLQTETSEEVELLVCTSSENCPVHSCQSVKSQWSFFAKQDDITRLLECLNERGIRESALRRVLIREKSRISDGISQCPAHRLNPTKFQFSEYEQRKSTRSTNYRPDSVHLDYPAGTPVHQIMEYTLRELILELENKITSGCVGSLKVNDRLAWRTTIENGQYDKQCDKLIWGFKMRKSLKKKSVTEQEKENDCYDKKQNWEKEEEEEEEEENETRNVCGTREEDCVLDKHESEEMREEDQEEDAATDFTADGTDTTAAVAAVVDKATNGTTDTVGVMAKATEVTVTIDAAREAASEEEGKATMLEEIEYANTLSQDVRDCPVSPKAAQKVTSNVKSSDSELIGTVIKSLLITDGSKKEKDEETSSAKEDNTHSIDDEGTTDENGDKMTDSGSFPGKRSFDLLTPPKPVVKDMACALLQVGQSIDRKFLQKPLADEDNAKTMTRLKYWEVSLMNTVNFSQIFIHHSTLENSIDWSKSTLNAPCCICKRKGDAEKMLLCDGCNKGHHIYCLKPKLKCIPKDDWFCPVCTELKTQQGNEEKNFEGSDYNSDLTDEEMMGKRWTKDRHRKFLTQEEGNSDALLEQCSQLRESTLLNLCSKCKLDEGSVIVCSSCELAYHPECMKRPIRLYRLQKENWTCESCKSSEALQTSDDETVDYREDEATEECATDTSIYESETSFMETPRCTDFETVEESHESADELSDMYPGENRSLSVRERRGCASATLAKIATFTKRLRSNSWDDDGSELSQLVADPDEPSNSNFNLYETAVRKSSRRAVYASDNLPLDNAVLQDLMADLIHHEDAWPFLRPVRRSQVPDYHKVVKKAMDLGTVKYKLNTAEYKTNREFIGDVMLMFKNCYMYNREETIEYQCGERLRAFFEEKCENLGLKWERED